MANGKIKPVILENGEIKDPKILAEIIYKIQSNSNIIIKEDNKTFEVSKPEQDKK